MSRYDTPSRLPTNGRGKKLREPALRGGTRVFVDGKPGVIVSCERQRKPGHPGRRVYLVQLDEGGEPKRYSARQIQEAR